MTSVITSVIALVTLLIAVKSVHTDDVETNQQISDEMVKFLDAFEMYRLIRNNSDDERTDFDHEHDNHENGDLDDLQGRAPNCARCVRARKRKRTTPKPEIASFFTLPKIPAFNWGENANQRPRQATKERVNKHHEKTHQANTGISVSGLYLALEEGRYHEGGFLVPVYDSAYMNSHEYKRRRKVNDWLDWADKIEEKTEDPCVIYVICQIGLNPNDFGRLGDDLRRLIRRPTIYLRKIIQRYFTATTFDWTKINFGACKNQLRQCMVSSDKQRWVDMGFPIVGVFTD